MDLELRHLRMVCAIAEAGSVTKAAGVLGLAQPALTTQLRRIERSLGGPLFVRERRGVRPTPLGDLVLARARVLLPAINGLQDEAGELISAGQAARYRIGATNGPIAGGLMHRLTAAHPGTGVSIHSTWSENEICDRVSDDRLDYALVGVCADAIPTTPGLVWQPVAVDAVWMLISDRHPLAGRDEIALAELADEQWVTAPGDGCFSECVSAACGRAGFAPKPAFELDPGGVLDLVASGSAVALCQGTTRDLPGAVAVPLADTPLRWRHLLGWDPGRRPQTVVNGVFDLAVQAYREIVEQRPRYSRWLTSHPGFGAQRLGPPIATTARRLR